MNSESERTFTEVAANLGIEVNLLYRWRKQISTNWNRSFPENGNELVSDDQKAIKELKKQLKNTEVERDILKKLWPFSAEHWNEWSL
ncbi:MAG: transposase [Candidatus Scalindua sp.]|nr:transposase [Candidatus Scalindua sp.]